MSFFKYYIVDGYKVPFWIMHITEYSTTGFMPVELRSFDGNRVQMDKCEFSTRCQEYNP